MEFVFIYSLPTIISFIFMNKCYKKDLLDYPMLAALCCIIPIVNWIGLMYFLKKLCDD